MSQAKLTMPLENFFKGYLERHGITMESPDKSWEDAIVRVCGNRGLTPKVTYLLSDTPENQRIVILAASLIEKDFEVGNLKIRPELIIHDISNGHKCTKEAAKAWETIRLMMEMHHKNFLDFNFDAKEETLLTGVYSNCVFLVSDQFGYPDLIGASSRLRRDGYQVAQFALRSEWGN